MKSPKAGQESPKAGVENQEDTFKVTLLKEVRGPADHEGNRDLIESDNLLEKEVVELSELKKIIRNNGINQPSSSAAQAGVSFFTGTDSENRRAFENDEITEYSLWIYEKNGVPLTHLQLAREAAALGVPFSQKNVEEQAYDKIRENFARTLFVAALADQAEEIGYPGISGADWFNLAPEETPAAADRAADYLIRRLELDNGCDVVTLFKRALGANPDLDRNKALEDFGYSIPMQSMGHGVGWTDNHEPFQIGYPFYFSGNDLILIGQEDLKQLPRFDEMDVDSAALAELPEKTGWGFSEDYEPPIEPRTPIWEEGPSA